MHRSQSPPRPSRFSHSHCTSSSPEKVLSYDPSKLVRCRLAKAAFDFRGCIEASEYGAGVVKRYASKCCMRFLKAVGVRDNPDSKMGTGRGGTSVSVGVISDTDCIRNGVVLGKVGLPLGSEGGVKASSCVGLDGEAGRRGLGGGGNALPSITIRFEEAPA